jgi:hypothetical protein
MRRCDCDRYVLCNNIIITHTPYRLLKVCIVQYVRMYSTYTTVPAKTSVRPKRCSVICSVPLSVGALNCSTNSRFYRWAGRRKASAVPSRTDSQYITEAFLAILYFNFRSFSDIVHQYLFVCSAIVYFNVHRVGDIIPP